MLDLLQQIIVKYKTTIQTTQYTELKVVPRPDFPVLIAQGSLRLDYQYSELMVLQITIQTTQYSELKVLQITIQTTQYSELKVSQITIQTTQCSGLKVVKDHHTDYPVFTAHGSTRPPYRLPST